MLVIGVITGFVTGVLSGLLGIGGGAILVASAVSFMGVSQHMAQAAAIASTIPTAIVGVINLHRKKLVNYPVAFLLAIGVAIGGILGAYLANMLSGQRSKKYSVFFSPLCLYTCFGLHGIRKKNCRQSRQNSKREKSNHSSPVSYYK